jgi:hypothetical protein
MLGKGEGCKVSNGGFPGVEKACGRSTEVFPRERMPQTCPNPVDGKPLGDSLRGGVV